MAKKTTKKTVKKVAKKTTKKAVKKVKVTASKLNKKQKEFFKVCKNMQERNVDNLKFALMVIEEIFLEDKIIEKSDFKLIKNLLDDVGEFSYYPKNNYMETLID